MNTYKNTYNAIELKKIFKKFLEITITAILGICLLISMIMFIWTLSQVGCNGLDVIKYLLPMLIIFKMFEPMAKRCLDWLYPDEVEEETNEE